MEKQITGEWKTDHLPSRRRPKKLPKKWGAYFLADDLTKRFRNRRTEESLYAVGFTAFQFMLAVGPPWTCFRTDGTPWPTFVGDLPTGTVIDWEVFSPKRYADFLAHYEGGLPPDRVAEILGRVDLLADYLAAAGAISPGMSACWIRDTQRIIEKIEKSVCPKPRPNFGRTSVQPEESLLFGST